MLWYSPLPAFGAVSGRRAAPVDQVFTPPWKNRTFYAKELESDESGLNWAGVNVPLLSHTAEMSVVAVKVADWFTQSLLNRCSGLLWKNNYYF